MEVKWGSLRLETLAFTLPERPGKVRVTVDDNKIGNDAEYKDGRLGIKLDRELVVDAGQKIEVHV